MVSRSLTALDFPGCQKAVTSSQMCREECDPRSADDQSGSFSHSMLNWSHLDMSPVLKVNHKSSVKFPGWGHLPPSEAMFYLEAFLGRRHLRTHVPTCLTARHLGKRSPCNCRPVFRNCPRAVLKDKACVLATPSTSSQLLLPPGERISLERPHSRVTDLAYVLSKESQQSSKIKRCLVFP